jgi:hypothetical protein
MLAIDKIDNIFGLGQDAVPASAPSVKAETRNVIIPAIPDNTVVRCKFDQSINGFRCSPVSVFEPPTVFLLAAAGLAVLGIGYVFGRTRFLPRFVERVAEEPIRRR